MQRRVGNHLVDKFPRERELMFRAAFFAERTAHEAAAVFGASKNHLGQHRLIETAPKPRRSIRVREALRADCTISPANSSRVV